MNATDYVADTQPEVRFTQAESLAKFAVSATERNHFAGQTTMLESRIRIRMPPEHTAGAQRQGFRVRLRGNSGLLKSAPDAASEAAVGSAEVSTRELEAAESACPAHSDLPAQQATEGCIGRCDCLVPGQTNAVAGVQLECE